MFDYSTLKSSGSLLNDSPRLTHRLLASPSLVNIPPISDLSAAASGANREALNYSWIAEVRSIVGDGNLAALAPGSEPIGATAEDEQGGTAGSDAIMPADGPQTLTSGPNSREGSARDTVTLVATAPNGRPLAVLPSDITVRSRLTNSASLAPGTFTCAPTPANMDKFRRHFGPLGRRRCYPSPVISGIQVSTTAIVATITWSTDQSTTGALNYGLSNSYGSTASDPTMASSHSLTLTGLVCNSVYYYQIASTGQYGNVGITPASTFTTGPCAAPGSPVSDDFHSSTLNTKLWTFYAACCGFVKMNGTDALLVVPSGTDHNIFNMNQGVGLFQPSSNVDFEVETKFDSAVTLAYQLEGVVVQQDSSNFILFDVYHDGSTPRLLAVTTVAGVGTIQNSSVISSGGAPFWLRIRRAGDTWTESWSVDGKNYSVGAVFVQPMTVTAAGPIAGNALLDTNPAPSFTAAVDYFFNTAAPISPADGGQPPLPKAPLVNVWYGDSQTFGQNGIPQNWVNVLGNTTALSGVTSITYSLNGGPEQPLSIGDDATRLVDIGDFNAEIAYSSLNPGANAVRFTATAQDGTVSQHTVTVNYVAGQTWPPAYRVNWSGVTNIQNVVQIVDGQWSLQNGAVRTTQVGYDRLLDLGGLNTWTNLTGTAEITINTLDCTSFALGVIVGWTGHTTDSNGVILPDQPRTGHPFPADFVYTDHGLAIGSNSSQTPEATLAENNTILSPGVKYTFKFQIAPNNSGGSHFSFKVWQSGLPEPTAWQLEADNVLSRGSVVIAAHRADITVGNISVIPLP